MPLLLVTGGWGPPSVPVKDWMLTPAAAAAAVTVLRGWDEDAVKVAGGAVAAQAAREEDVVVMVVVMTVQVTVLVIAAQADSGVGAARVGERREETRAIVRVFIFLVDQRATVLELNECREVMETLQPSKEWKSLLNSKGVDTTKGKTG